MFKAILIYLLVYLNKCAWPCFIVCMISFSRKAYYGGSIWQWMRAVINLEHHSSITCILLKRWIQRISGIRILYSVFLKKKLKIQMIISSFLSLVFFISPSSPFIFNQKWPHQTVTKETCILPHLHWDRPQACQRITSTCHPHPHPLSSRITWRTLITRINCKIKVKQMIQPFKLSLINHLLTSKNATRCLNWGHSTTLIWKTAEKRRRGVWTIETAVFDVCVVPAAYLSGLPVSYGSLSSPSSLLSLLLLRLQARSSCLP